MINKQDFINAFNQNIEMVKGDTLAFNFQVQGLDGGEPTFIFTVKENPDDNILFTADLNDGITLNSYDANKDVATYNIRISPAKTRNLDLARYYYDLEMNVNGDVFTLMRGRFTLLYKVSN